jgi:hypothetical protein
MGAGRHEAPPFPGTTTTVRTRLVVAIVTLVAGSAAPTASAEIYEGDPFHGTAMDMWTDARGRVSKLIFSWSGKCRHAREEDSPSEYTGGGRSTLRPPRRSSRRFSVVHAYRQRFRHGHRLHIRIRMRGTRRDRKRWSGTYRVLVNVYRDGRHRDVCRTPPTAWRARRIPRWRLEVRGEPGDYVTQGRTWVLAPPAHRALTSGDPDSVLFTTNPWPDGADSWHGEFEAPPGERLEVGRTYQGAWETPARDGRPALSISGMGRGCHLLTGEFTIHALEFARPWEVEIGFNREISRLRVSFVQHCGSQAAARGTFDYRL